MEKKILRAQRVAQLESDLNIIKKQLSSLVSFNDQETVISELASLSPDSDLIQSLSTRFKPILRKELDVIIKPGSRNDAEILASKYTPLLVAFQLNDQLTEIKLAHLKGDIREKAITKMINTNVNDIESALSSIDADNQQWEIKLLRNIQELASLSKQNNNANKKHNNTQMSYVCSNSV